MATTYLLNPHCQKPHLVIDKHRWLIRFHFEANGSKKSFKNSYTLNSSSYLLKQGEEYKQINKFERKALSAELIQSLHEKLKTDYFNPISRKFELSDKSLLPLRDYLKSYLDYNPRKQREEASISIYKSYNNVITQFFVDKGLADISLKQINRDMIVDFLNSKEQDDNKTQRDNYLVYLKGFFNYCVDYLQVLPKNPLKLLHTINVHESETNRAYPLELRELVLNQARLNDKYFWILLRLIFYTLRRPDELLKLQYKDFDFVKGTIDFSSKKIKTKRRLYSKLMPHLVKELRELIPDDVKPDDYFLGSFPKPNKMDRRIKALFAVEKTPLYHFQDRFKAIQYQLNLENGYTIYSFKHTGIVYMIEELEWDDNDIITYTGHTDTKILGRYSRDAKRKRKEHSAII